MHDLNFAKRVLISALFFFLSSCSSKCPQWEIDSVLTRPPCHNMGKVFFPTSNSFAGIELELSRLNNQVVAYLNVFSIDLATPTQQVNVKIVIENEEFTYCGAILKGGQRVMLPLDASEKLVEALSEELEVFIQVGRYEQIIPSTNFINVYGELMMIPID